MQLGQFENAFNHNPTVYFMSKTELYLTSQNRFNIYYIFQSLQPSLATKNLSGTKFLEIWIIKTCYEQNSNDHIRVEKRLPEYYWGHSQNLLYFLKPIAFSSEIKFVRLKIYRIFNHSILLKIAFQRSTPCRKMPFGW